MDIKEDTAIHSGHSSVVNTPYYNMNTPYTHTNPNSTVNSPNNDNFVRPRFNTLNETIKPLSTIIFQTKQQSKSETRISYGDDTPTTHKDSKQNNHANFKFLQTNNSDNESENDDEDDGKNDKNDKKKQTKKNEKNKENNNILSTKLPDTENVVITTGKADINSHKKRLSYNSKNAIKQNLLTKPENAPAVLFFCFLFFVFCNMCCLYVCIGGVCVQGCMCRCICVCAINGFFLLYFCFGLLFSFPFVNVIMCDFQTKQRKVKKKNLKIKKN